MLLLRSPFPLGSLSSLLLGLSLLLLLLAWSRSHLTYKRLVGSLRGDKVCKRVDSLFLIVDSLPLGRNILQGKLELFFLLLLGCFLLFH